MNQLMPKPVTVLYLGSLTHSEDTNFLDRTRPHEDEIDFQTAAKICLIRIPRPGKDIYSKHISITQTLPIKNLQIYYRNLEKTTGRYSLLMSINELIINQNDDILITPKQPIFTDLILFKGNFTKITLCIYGNIIRDQHFLSQKCPNFRANAFIDPMSQSLMQIQKDVFEQKREVIRQIQSETAGSDSIEEWHQVVNDDGINEQQIENICNLSQKLLTTYNNQQLTQEPFVVQFRAGLEDISTNLAKIFKNKHIGLYYPSFQDSAISNDLSLSITQIALYSLDLSLSEQVRGLEILKFVLQLDRHTDFFIDHQGVQKLMRIFVDFFKINSVVLSTYKNLCLQVLISVSHWKKAALKMTQTVNNAFYHEVFEDNPLQTQKVSEDRERSREKKASKRSRSGSVSSKSDENNKKKKKDKQKKRNKSRQKKRGKQARDEIADKGQEVKEQQGKGISLRDEIPNISFYQILFFYLQREKSCKQLTLVKILLEQILQTIKKNKVVSERVALSTSLLKDLKYIFNPAGQVLNTKSLKQFASCYQPFLNSVQSEGVESQIVAEKQKLRHMHQYGIDPKICKILNRLSMEIASSQCDENQDETRTAYNQSFIVMMSELIRSRNPPVLYGFGRLLGSFQDGSSRDIVHLKRMEGAMTVIGEYVYKVLVEDDGLFTVLNIDQIYSALINISNCLSKDQSAFTRELKRKVRQLTNYAMAYDLFTSSEGNFKTISEYFLRLFKFQHYEINKISEFKKKQFEKAANPSSVSNLTQFYALGSFHDLFPEQPLLQIDVYLKIFNIVLQYNKNAWPIFYQNKLVCGFSVLFTRLSNMIKFFVQSTLQRDCALASVKKPNQNLENYLNVTLRLLKILTKRAEYEAAFNDLLDEDSFENVELYQKAFLLYISLFNAINNASSLLSASCKKLADLILAKILSIYDKLLESYELTTHQSRESKIKELWLQIYKTHFMDIKSRSACLSLFAFFIETLESNNMKIFNSLCLEEGVKIETQAGSEIRGYVPNNENSIIYNLINFNIYRTDPLLRANLALLLKNLLQKNSQKYSITEKITTYFEAIFDDLDSKLKQKLFAFNSPKDFILLQKITLLTDLLRSINCILTNKFDEKLIRHYKLLESIKKDNQHENNLPQKALKLLLKIKTNILIYFKKNFSEKPENPQFLPLIQLLAKNLEFSQKITQAIQQNTLCALSLAEIQIQRETLNLLNSSLEVICACSSNPFNQSIILYEVFLEKPYKPAPQLSLVKLFTLLTSAEFLTFISSSEQDMVLQNQEKGQSYSCVQGFKKVFKQIGMRMVYFLCLLTSIDSRDFYSTESRRAAITCITTDEKEFPFSKLQHLKAVIPIYLIQTLKDYFAYPIVEKALSMKSDDKKQSLKNKGYLFSKALFSIIMEGEVTAKSRYPFIGGPWKSGDLSTNFLYTPSKQKNYAKNLSKFLNTQSNSTEFFTDSLITKISPTNLEKLAPELIEFSTKKRNKVVEKKAVAEIQLKAVNIPLVLQNFVPKIDQSTTKRVSPSPSNKTGYGRGNQVYETRVRVSPSPPNTKLPSQNIIGFSAPNQPQSQYPMQHQPGSGYSRSTSPGIQAQNMSVQGKIGQGLMPISSNLPYEQSAKNAYENQKAMKEPIMQRPVYPNPYYSTNQPQKSNTIENQTSTPPIMPFLEMQKVGSHDLSGQQRSGSNSASRSIPPLNTGMGYQPQSFYGGDQPYTNPHHKITSYDHQSSLPHQNRPYSHNYANQRTHNGNYYVGPQDRLIGQGFSGGPADQMMGTARGYGSHSMINRSYNNGYNKFEFQTRNQPQNYQKSQIGGSFTQFGIGQNYPPNFSYNQAAEEDERQYNDAILLVTEIRGNLPDHLKNDKKNQLQQIIIRNPRVQIRVKQYINSLK